MSVPVRGACRRARAGRGFTLLEAVLGLALVVGLSGAVFTFLFNLGRSRDGLGRATEALRGVGALFEGLEADIVGVVAGGDGRPGVSGDERSIRLLTRGVIAPVLGEGRGRIMGDLQGVEYRFVPERGVIEARRWDATAPDGGGEVSAVLASGVGRVRMRYFDGSTWSASFDSSRHGGLPVAIEIAVWFGVSGSAGTAAGGAGPGADAGDWSEGAWSSEEEAWPEDEWEQEEEFPEPGARLPTPDRVRMILIPDGPIAAWREGP